MALHGKRLGVDLVVDQGFRTDAAGTQPCEHLPPSKTRIPRKNQSDSQTVGLCQKGIQLMSASTCTTKTVAIRPKLWVLVASQVPCDISGVNCEHVPQMCPKILKILPACSFVTTDHPSREKHRPHPKSKPPGLKTLNLKLRLQWKTFAWLMLEDSFFNSKVD